MPRSAIGRNSSNNHNPHPIKTMAWPIINILLGAIIVYLALAASGLPVA
jgi:hypothetical protein